VLAATNEALRAAERMMQAKMSSLMSGFGDFRLPGL